MINFVLQNVLIQKGKRKNWHEINIISHPLLKETYNSTNYEVTIGLSTTRETTSYAATLELPSISWNAKVHYRFHESPPLVPVLSQKNPIHTTHSTYLKLQLHNILPLASRAS